MRDCPVCESPSVVPLIRVNELEYWRCDLCEARFLDPAQHPPRETEYRHYLLHRNDPRDTRYRKFLSRLVEPLLARLRPHSSGLDYGCGPGPALAAMLREAGHSVALFDPIFFPDRAALRRRFDFITCTETAEHFHRPAEEFDRLERMLETGGWLAIMTCFQTDDERFSAWHYRRDPTHVVFYRETTFRHVAAARGWECEIPIANVALLRMPGYS